MLLGLLLTLAAQPAPKDGHTVTVVATDYAFEMPDSVAAGAITLRLVNHGRELHHLYLARLTGGHTAKDLVDAFKRGGPPPSWSADAGGPNGADPGAKSLAVTVPLTPGHYAALCIIPGPDGAPHIMKGMYKDLTVTGDSRASGALPKTATTIKLVDYAFDMSTLPTAGVHRVLVRNTSKQTHEMEIAQLLPGKTPGDLAVWAEKMAGPPPAHFIGGVSPLGPGAENVLALDLKPGHYVMLCFVPDSKDGKPHVVHGMVHDFVIR